MTEFGAVGVLWVRIWVAQINNDDCQFIVIRSAYLPR